MTGRVIATVRNLFCRSSVERDLDAEIRSFYTLAEDERITRGMSAEEAKCETRLAAGGIEQVKESIRDQRSGASLDALAGDIRYALRTMWRTRVLTLAALLSIALGVGANTGVFTVVNALFLQPLPVDRPDTIAALFFTSAKDPSASTQLSRLNFIDWRDRNRSFESMAAVAGPIPLSWQNGTNPVGIFSEFATGDYFRLLGITPYRGRFFGRQEDAPGTFAPVVVISFQCWKGRFGAEDVIGRTVRLNGQDFTIIGIAPAGFSGIHTFFGPEFWLPSSALRLVLGDTGRIWLEDRAQPVFNVFGRLKPNITRQTAQLELCRIVADLNKEFPTINPDASVSVRPLDEATVFPGLGRTGLTAGILLMGVVGSILLIACSNVANLLLARAVSRRHEIAVRAALGASRLRIIRQLLTESVLLGFMGGLAGIFFADQLRAVLWSFRPAVVAGSLVEPSSNVRVLIFGLLASVISGVLFGFAPAIEASRNSIIGTVRDESGSVGNTRWRSQVANLLLTGQVALCVLCLTIAALILRSIQALYSSDPGFDTQHLAMVSASPQQAGSKEWRSAEYYRQVRQRLTREKQVESVSWASTYPLFGGPSRGISVQGDSPRQRSRTSQVNVVDLEYFRTVGLPLLSGRDFDARDRAGSLPVAIVNQAFANNMMSLQTGSFQTVLGRRIRLTGESADRQIVAVSKTSVLTFLGEPPQPCIYIPLAQSPQPSMVLYVRSRGTPQPVLAAAERAMRQVDSNVSPADPMTIRDLIDNNLWIARCIAGLLIALGFLGLLLATVGLYGVTAYSVGQRRREIGLRLALGAPRFSVVLSVIRRGMLPVIYGLLVGSAVGFAAAAAIRSLLPQIVSPGLLGFISVALMMAGVGATACFVPARAASAVDPAVSLRTD